MNSDKHDTENVSELVHPVLILAEGKSDVSFLMQLLADRGLTDLHFSFPTDVTGGFGQTGFAKYLAVLPARTGFEKLRAIMIFYDNDDDPIGSFAAVTALIGNADPYAVPPAPMVLAAPQVGKVRLMLVPIPGDGVPGGLETLLLQSATQTSAEKLACIDALTACARAGNWRPSHDAKLRLRCLIAVSCRGNSDVTLTHIWGKTGNPVVLAHGCFDWLTTAVKEVVALM